MKYSLFLTDFDGTLVRADGTVSQKNIRAIEAYRRAGGVFAVVTGRMLASILPRLKELGLYDGLVSAYQGGTIAEIGTGKLLKCDGFARADALELIRALESEGLHLHVYFEDTLYCNRDDALLRSYEQTCGVKGIIPCVPLGEFFKGKSGVFSKLLCMVEPERRDELVFSLKTRYKGRFFVTSSSKWLVEIMPKGTDKAAAVEFLSRYFGVPKEKIAAIGDEANDIPMLQAAGGRFAVQNAVPALKAAAHKIVSSVEEDGVSEALMDAMEEI